MCIIIDNCVTGDYVNKRSYLQPVAKYVDRGGRVIVSASVFLEYPFSFQKIIVEWRRNGRVKQFEDVPLPRQLAQLLISNDSHVVALVRTSGVRVVCTTDANLIVDLKNPAIINAPRCKVYKKESAKSVLNGCRSCS